MQSERWSIHGLRRARLELEMSKDPTTQVGACIIGAGMEVLSMGFNGFPRGIADKDELIHNREVKNKITVHAEHNAILNAARNGVKLMGSTMYWMGRTQGRMWGGCPCSRCMGPIIQAGITRIVTVTTGWWPDTWGEDQKTSRLMLNEAGIELKEYSYCDVLVTLGMIDEIPF